MQKKLVVVGAGEFADIATEYFSAGSDYEVCGFSVEAEFLSEREKFGLPVVALEEIERHFPKEEFEVHVAITNTQLNQVRERLFKYLKKLGYTFASYVSPHAFVWRTAQLGENVFIFENNVVQHGVKVGDGVVLWSGNHIGHQSRIEEFAFLTSHVVVSGYCLIGRRSFVGVNSAFADHVEIGADTYVAMSSSVNKSHPEPGQLLTGVPAEASRVSSYRYCKVKP